MGKFVDSSVLDGSLTVIAGADLMVALPSQPATYAAAQSAKLAGVALVPGDFSIGAGSAGVRQLTIAAKAGVSVLATDDATHIALLDTSASKLLYVTICTAESLTQGGTVDFAGLTVNSGPVA